MNAIIENPDTYYHLKGSCIGCRRVTWLCRRDRRCAKYAITPKHGYVAMPTGYRKEAGIGLGFECIDQDRQRRLIHKRGTQ